MHDLVRGVWDDILLRQGLQSIGDRLKQAVGANSVWAIAVLNAPQALALQEGGQGKQGRKA